MIMMDQETPKKDNTLLLLALGIGAILLIAAVAGVWFYLQNQQNPPVPNGGNVTPNNTGTSGTSDNVLVPPAFPNE